MVSQDATIIVGTAVDDNMKDEIKVTLIATGLNASQRRAQKPDLLSKSQAQAPAGERRFPAFEAPAANDNDIFVRTVKPGMDNLNVPSFLKKNND